MKRIYLGFVTILVLASCDRDENIYEHTTPISDFPENIISYNFPLGTGYSAGQSPINVNTYGTMKMETIDLVIHYSSIVLNSVENTSVDLKINLLNTDKKNNYITIKGRKYQLQQFHFHHNSEHKVNNRYSEMEIHFVNRSESGAYAVLAVFVEKGKINSALQSLINLSPTLKGLNSRTDLFNLNSILPINLIGYYAYSGSLTTPSQDLTPNQGPVTWILFKNKITLPELALKNYSSIYPEKNFRVIQPLNNRIVYEN